MVVAIIAILAALLLPSLKSARARARVAACSSNLRQLGIAAHLYAGENGEYYPYAANWQVGTKCYEMLLAPYVGNSQRVWACPEDKSTVGDLQKRRTYVMNEGGRGLYGNMWSPTYGGGEMVPGPDGVASGHSISRKISDIEEPPNTILMAELAICFNSGNVETQRSLGVCLGQTVTVDHPYEQNGSYVNGSPTGQQRDLHPGGRFNYLFCDGHVAFLRGEDTLGKAATLTHPMGMWSKGAGD